MAAGRALTAMPSPRPRASSLRATRAGTVLVAALVAATLGSTAAHAHSGGLPDAQYYLSTVVAISPPVPGLEITVERSGETVALTNLTASHVDVLGYTGEEYLRFGPAGVEENTNSISAFLNGSLVIEGLPQQLSTPQQPPAWRHVTDASTFAWHDHRLHWMAQQRPPVVAADPAQPHKIFDWSLQLRVDGSPVVVTGVLSWVGAPAGAVRWPYFALGGTAAALAAILLAIRRRTARGRAVDEDDDPGGAPSLTGASDHNGARPGA